MKAIAWVRASQAILFEASIVPALAGTAAAVGSGAAFRPEYLGLILLSLVGIQAGANLFKGYYEGLDRSVPPSSPGAWFAFDTGAAIGPTRDSDWSRSPRTSSCARLVLEARSSHGAIVRLRSSSATEESERSRRSSRSARS